MAVAERDVVLPRAEEPEQPTPPLLVDRHVAFLHDFSAQPPDAYEQIMMQHLRVSGIYWCVAAAELMGRRPDAIALPPDDVVHFVASCQRTGSGFGASPGHDPHLLYTVSAVQICVMYGRLDAIDAAGAVAFVRSLQRDDGCFVGDAWGEVDTRFSLCALATLTLLGRCDAVDMGRAVEFILRCSNFDGGFGCRPGAESHAAQVYTCTAALALANALHRIDADRVGWWLCQRQLPSGGLNGRPEKLPDVCYSWWVAASLAIIGRLQWIDAKALHRYILHSQDTQTGGFADRPGDIADPFHTLFALAGLALFNEPGLEPVDPVLCMPRRCLAHIARPPLPCDADV